MGAAFFLALLAFAADPSAASPRVRIVSAEEALLLLPSATILDARERESFEKGHLPGSRAVDWRDFTLERPGAWNALFGDATRWGKVPLADAALQKKLRALGLSNARPVLVVGTPGGWGEEGRIAWNLLYWGAEDVALLDGGFPAWAAVASRPIARGKAGTPDRAGRMKPGDFTITLRPERRIELADLRIEVERKKRPLLDARTPGEYHGETMPGQKRGGHIPGSQLVPAASLYRPDGTYVHAPALAATLAAGAAALPISYCTGGVRSALLAVLVEARLGVVVANYDGSMWEWSAHPELPLNE
ncbi:MAG: rhodanese-like domain-containing protein [Thermoanaerobaculia bacterium]